MIAQIRFMRLSLLVAGIALCLAGQAAQASTVIVGTCKNGVQFNTIGAAVAASPNGGIIDICPGIYPEQITIKKKLSLVGIPGGGSSVSDAAVIVAPATGLVVNAADITAFPVAAQIFVDGTHGANAVTISHLTIDGSNNQISGCGTQLEGIYFVNSTGTITDNVVRNQILDPAYEGCQNGLAINVESTTGTPLVTISNNSVRNYDKNGITADGLGSGAPGPNVVVKGNTVIGIGATPAIAQNGIQIGFGATGSITGNYVADDIYSGAYWGSSGILIYASAGVTVSDNTVESSQYAIASASDPTYGLADGATITSNHIGGTVNFDAIDICSSHNTVGSNIIYGSAQSAIHVDDECPGPSSAASGNNNTIQKNTVNEACAGILQGAGTGNTYTTNTFMNTTYTTLAGDTCPPSSGPTSNGTAKQQKSLRPAPYRSGAK